MLEAIRACNRGLCQSEPDYAARMTADDENDLRLLDDFVSVDREVPVVVTTSKLLSTGVDTKCVKLIVLDANIRGMTEFKQIIGRGTRLREDAGKTFFTIMDFRGVCSLFADPDFDGPPDAAESWNPEDPMYHPPVDGPQRPDGLPSGEPEPPPGDPPDPEYYEVSGVTVSMVGRSVSYLDENGKLVTEKFEDYTRRNVLALFGDENGFIELWNGPEEKRALLERMRANGIFPEHLRKELGQPDMDEFDLILHIAFGHAPMTRHLRADRVRRGRFLDRYQGPARQILEGLLDVYARLGGGGNRERPHLPKRTHETVRRHGEGGAGLRRAGGVRGGAAGDGKGLVRRGVRSFCRLLKTVSNLSGIGITLVEQIRERPGMNISYKNTKTAKQFAVGRSLVKIHGAKRARLIAERLRVLQGARNLADFLPPYAPPERCHELKADMKECFSMDLDHPYRLIFKPDHDPVPKLPDGGTDWFAITDIIILGVEDTHD